MTFVSTSSFAANAELGAEWVEEDEATAKARAQKEKEAAEERKKKIEQSFKRCFYSTDS